MKVNLNTVSSFVFIFTFQIFWRNLCYEADAVFKNQKERD
jgi:hypothetical protein